MASSTRESFMAKKNTSVIFDGLGFFSGVIGLSFLPMAFLKFLKFRRNAIQRKKK
jgi:hypothetical protein